MPSVLWYGSAPGRLSICKNIFLQQCRNFFHRENYDRSGQSHEKNSPVKPEAEGVVVCFPVSAAVRFCVRTPNIILCVCMRTCIFRVNMEQYKATTKMTGFVTLYIIVMPPPP